MALDAAMLSSCLSLDAVLWRFYGWDEPAITFGYSQKWEWVREETPSFNGVRIRRLTGGGIVDHRHDLTYAMAIPATHPFHRRSARDVYEDLHRGIAEVLASYGIPASLAPCPGRCAHSELPPSGICFQSPEPFDVVSPGSGQKIAGAAMKRNKSGVLIQGSLSRTAVPVPEAALFSGHFGRFLERWLETGATQEAAPLPEEIITREAARFASPEWNLRR